jgi:hypothetical protein
MFPYIPCLTHNLSRGAVAALITVMLNESGLHGMKMIGLTQSFNGGDLIVRVHDGKRETRVDPSSIDVDRASPALAVIAALLGAGEI